MISINFFPMIKRSLICLAFAAVMATVSAQEQVPQPTLVKITFPEAAAITQLSDNGAWAVACGAGEDQSLPDYPYLVDAATGELTRLWDPDNPVMGA